jgi:hypothetical protein
MVQTSEMWQSGVDRPQEEVFEPDLGRMLVRLSLLQLTHHRFEP